jgi:magnesium transporter
VRRNCRHHVPPRRASQCCVSPQGAFSAQTLEQRPGALPAQLFVHGGAAPTHFDAVVFEAEAPRHWPHPEIAGLIQLRQQGVPLWLRLRGLADRPRIEELLQRLQVPQVLAEPLLTTPQRPQVDCLEDVVLVVLHRLGFASDPDRLLSDQVGMLLLPGLLITVEEAPAAAAAFPDLTTWLLERSTAIEDRDLDDILHFLIDDLLDELFPILETISRRLDDLEEDVLRRPKPKLLSRTFRYRSLLRAVRSQVWPLRHQIRMLLREHQQLLGPEALGGFQEMDGMVELLFENCELLRSQCDAITQAYGASVGNRMNQVMKALTILTSIFAPLTFIAGIYGMNFRTMPELDWRFGYPLVLLLMAVIAAFQSWWLWRRGWFQDWTAQR